MEILVNGRQWDMRGYIQLNDPIDGAFRDLFTSFFNDPGHSFDNLSQTYLPEFENSALQYLDRIVNNSLLQDRFFTNLTFIWRKYLDGGRLGEAQAFWQRILQPINQWEENRASRVHTGSPLYFWAVVAILQGEVDKGFFLMHSAYQEDVETQNTEFPPSPAFWFVTLDFDRTEQFFHDYVRHLALYLDQFLHAYRLVRPSNLQLSEFRDLFLVQPPSKHAVFSFAHTLARLRGLDIIPTYALQSEFAGQYELSLFFDLALVIDEAIAERDTDPNHRYFLDFAEFLSGQSGLNLTRDDLRLANREINNDFDRTLASLLDATFLFQDGLTRSRLECDVAVAYCLRNHAAHNRTAFPSVWRRYQEIRQGLFNVLFLCVDGLYR
jgi:hypothetical protein